MIDKVNSQIVDWFQETVGDIPVSLSAPDATVTERGIGCYLLDLVDNPPMRGTQRTPNQLSLRYLITTWAEETAEAHSLLGNLAFATINHPEYEALFERVDAALWAAFGVKPRPSFILEAPLRQDRLDPDIQRVRKPLSILASPLVEVHGIVTGPENMLVAGARIQIPHLSKSTTSDRNGRFHFAALPVEPPIRQLAVRFKGHEEFVSIAGPESKGLGTEAEPILVQVDLSIFQEE